MSEVTALLGELQGGRDEAMGELVPLVYDELYAIARRQLRGQRPGQTLNATALVHEAYVKMVGGQGGWADRSHFLAVAAVAMRQVLINYAHRKKAQKRGGGQAIATFDESVMGASARADELIALDEALTELAKLDERQARVVELRFFGGLTHDEVAAVLGLSEPTVRRDWRAARAWLARWMKG
ncbi:MAG: sigma-70 family RNA polymerase sigma factor [Bacteroidota bacterium]